MLVLLFVPCIALYAQTERGMGAVVGDFRYTFGSDDGVSCDGFVRKGVKCHTIEIPDYIVYNGKVYTVTEISSYAFNAEKNCTMFQEIHFPQNLKKIGDHAFSQHMVGNKNDDFLACDKIELPETLEEIGEGAFAFGNYKHVYIPGSVKKIGYGAFAYCNALESFEVNNNSEYSTIRPSGYNILMQNSTDRILQVCGKSSSNSSIDIGHNIESLAFTGCKNLKRVNFVWNTEYVGEYAFYDCTSLEEIDFSGNNADDIVFGNTSLKKSSFYVEGVYTHGEYYQPKNILADFFGDIKTLKSIKFNNKQLPSNVLCKDGVFYMIEQQANSKQNVAKVLYVLPAVAKETMYFQSVGNEETTYDIRGAKYAAFGNQTKDVYFESPNDYLSDKIIDVDYDSRNNNEIWKTLTIHVPYKFSSDAPNLKWFYDDSFNTPYKTIFFEHPYVIPQGMKGAVVSGVEDLLLNVDYQYAPGEIVPANTGLLLKKDEDATWSSYRMDVLGDDVQAKSVAGLNYLRGYAEPYLGSCKIEEKPGELYYMLSYDKNHERIGFFWGDENGGSFYTSANRAYLALPSAMAASMMVFNLDDNSVTGIESAELDTQKNDGVYSLDGRKMQGGKLNPGLYIVNGKKVMVK